jgi:phosphatidylserine decarboxylase
MGRFKLGSTVILLFGADAVRWQDALVAGAPLKMGQSIARGPATLNP